MVLEERARVTRGQATASGTGRRTKLDPLCGDQSTRGFDAGKKINGRKRHIAVDTLGLPVMITVTPADTTDRDAARELL